MKKKSFLLGLLGLLTLIPLGASAEDVLMPQFGKQVVLVEKDNPITYYDYKGTGTIYASSTNNSFATTIFKPAEEGYAVTIHFESVDLQSDFDNFVAKLNVYNGVFDTTSVTYPTITSEVKTLFPTTDNLLETLDGTYSDKIYTSTDATGALSCCFYFKYPQDSEGWKATVSVVKLDPMTILSATADYSDVEGQVYAGKPNNVLGAVNIATEGLLSADTLKTISFTLAQNGVYDAAKLRLYKGDATTKTAVDATLSQNSDTYTFSFNQALSSGDNRFFVSGDVLGTAKVDATSTLTITGISTFKGYTTLTTTTPVQQTVIPMVLMVNNEHLTVTIDRETPFYDDGGVDGKISNNFSGYVTFVPATDGKKIQIDLHDIHIFIASNPANSDVLKFYNGKTADEANLLYNVTDSKIDNLTLKSTSEDGAMTVYLYSKTPGSYVQGSGFEAVVSEFSVVQMTMASSSVTKQIGKVAGCAAGVQAMRFCLTTENTEPALQPTLFHFNTGNTYERIDSATLYFTGASNAFATTQKIGKVAVTANEFTIPASGISLTEGENYFFLTYDVACNVQNGQTIAANITQVNFSNNTEYKNFSNSADVLTIDNTLYSDCGNKTIYVYGEWIFTHTPQDAYSTSYKAEECDQQTIFVPTTDGMVIQMDFTDFAVSYNNYSKATFRIYAGQGTSGELLWEADKDNCATGPGLVRSTAKDGSLTVVFNANTEYRTYVGADKGWHATVSEYLPKPMAIEATTLTALSQDALTRGQKSAALLGINITTTGDLTPLGVKNITVTLSDCAAAVDSLLLLQGETIVARAEVKGTEVVLPLNVTLVEGENAYTMAANIAQDATIGTEVSVLGVQIAVGEATLTPAVPANKRTIRNMYILKSGAQHVEVDNAPLSFYDDGGPEGKVTLGLKGTVTFVPTVPNTAIQLKFKQWALNGADNFYVYYGENTKDKVDVSLSYYTKDIDKLTLISEDATGAITVTYESRGSIATDGWEIEVSCHELQPLTLDSVKVEDVSAATVNRGSVDVQILRAAVYVSGDRGKLPVENFNVENTLGAGAVKVYSTGTLDAFGTTSLVATADTITNRGTYYYWITIDVPVSTEEGATITATLKSVDVNKTTVQPKNVVTASFEVIGGMHGTYLVGASDAAKYKTIQSAIDALQNGIESAVTFLIEPGTYTEYLTIPEIDGVSAENTVTFRSQTGNREDVIIKYDTYSPQSSFLGDATQGIVNVNGADYITFSNLTLTTGNDSYHSVVLVRNKSEHVTIDNCNIYRDLTLTTGKHVVYVTAKDEKTINNYFTLSNSTLTGGYIGVSVSGNLNNQQVGARIIGNTVTEQGSMGIYLSGGERQALVDGNIVKNTATTKASTKAMDITLSEGSQVSNNYLYTNLGVNADGLYIRVIKGTEEAPVQIFNNVIDHCTNGTSSSYAVNFNKASTNTIFANNTIRTSGELVYPCRIGTTQNNLQVLNNIFYSDAAAAMWISSKNYIATTTFEHNLLYSESGKLGKIGADEYNDIAAWRTAINSTNDISESVQFESAEVLRPKNKGNLVSAQVLDFVTTDITGLKRAAVPTIGAYEYVGNVGTDCRPSEATSIRVYPTITRDMLCVSGAADAEVRILNLQGQLMYRTMLAADAETLDVNALPQGTYLIAVNGNVLRFIKQ